jgi:hypothetical protein
MAPQLGVLSTVHPQAATEVFDKDCLIRLGSSVCAVGEGKEGTPCFKIKITHKSGEVVEREVKVGEMMLVPFAVLEKAQAVIQPARNFDLGAGKGKELEVTVEGGIVGIVLDGRGRPMVLPEDKAKRVQKLQEWNKALNIYPG